MDPAWCSESQGNMVLLHQIRGVSNFKPITRTLPIKTKKLYSQESKHFNETEERLNKLHPTGNISHEKY